MAKLNGKIWLLGICSVLITGAFGSGFDLLLNVSRDVSAIKVAVETNGTRLSRMEIRYAKAIGELDVRLRNIEIGH